MTRKKKKRLILIILGLLVLTTAIVVIVSGNDADNPKDAGQITIEKADEPEDIAYDDESSEEDELEGIYDDNSLQPTAKGVDIVGIWTDKQGVKAPEDMQKGPYTAYKFDEYQFVTKLTCKADGSIENIYGAWEIKDNDKSTVYIQWKDINDEIISEESFKYSVKDKQLTMDNVTYAPLPEEEAYISMFY